MLWDSIKDGFAIVIVLSFCAFLLPSSAVLGLYVMEKIVPQLAPTCEVTN
jgi:hypothetical protein